MLRTYVRISCIHPVFLRRALHLTIDPKTLVTVIHSSDQEVYLSELDALVAEQVLPLGGTLEPADVTAGLRMAIRKGWLLSDGLRVTVSGGGRRVLDPS